MRFLADMGVAPKVVAWLKEQGHDAWHLAERGLERLPDPEIFGRAAEEQRIVLTFDLDFGEILALVERYNQCHPIPLARASHLARHRATRKRPRR